MNEQMEILDQVLGELQKNVARRAVQFFRYGWIILAGCLTHFLLVFLGKEAWLEYIWIAVPVLCILLGVASGFSSSNQSNVSLSEKQLMNTWGIVGFLMIYISFVAPNLGFIPEELILPLVMTLMFVSIIITGLTIRHTPTILLSSLWFLGSITASMVPGEFFVHILTVVVVLGYLLPAYLIKAKYY